jgi:Glycoside Hydrolase Family 113
MARPRRTRNGLGVVLPLLALTILAGGCEENLPTAPDTGEGKFVRGFTLADWTASGYGRSIAEDQIVTLAELGSSTLGIVVTAYQTDARSPSIRAFDPRTPTPTAVAAAIDRAREVGLEIAIKLHVDLDSGEWRGTIAPPDRAEWFTAYQGFVLAWSDFAAAKGVEVLMVGTELASLVEEDAYWRALIRDVRSRFSGRLVYAASWGGAFALTFWDALDFVGVDFWQPVATDLSPSRQQIVAAWQPWVDQLRRLSAQAGRPILFTELGYRSVDGAGMRPYRFGTLEPIDLAEQADLYWAALQVLSENNFLRGVFWWNWLAEGKGGAMDIDYTPKDKPAMEELRRSWGQVP